MHEWFQNWENIKLKLKSENERLLIEVEIAFWTTQFLSLPLIYSNMILDGNAYN